MVFVRNVKNIVNLKIMTQMMMILTIIPAMKVELNLHGTNGKGDNQTKCNAMNFFMLRFFVTKLKATLRSNDMVPRYVGNRMTGKTGGTDKPGVPLVPTLRGKHAGKHIVE
jgi:hypothetical protein